MKRKYDCIKIDDTYFCESDVRWNILKEVLEAYFECKISEHCSERRDFKGFPYIYVAPAQARDPKRIVGRSFSSTSVKTAFETVRNIADLDPLIKEIDNATPRLPVINGYEGVLDMTERVFKYGCAEITMELIVDAHNMIKCDYLGNRKITSIKLDSGVELTIEEIEALYNALRDE